MQKNNSNIILIMLGLLIMLFLIDLTLITKNTVHASNNTSTISKNTNKKSIMRVPISATKSSELTPYPNLSKYHNVWIKVSIPKQRVYIKNGDDALYTMYASTGKDSNDKGKTPTGTYYIQNERGHYFWANSTNEGAYNYVSFKDHGVYLFHSNPVDAQGKLLQPDASDLGKRPSSHGCIHLSTSDSRWFYKNIPTNTKVVIH